jgi:hypothetical protein
MTPPLPQIRETCLGHLSRRPFCPSRPIEVGLRHQSALAHDMVTLAPRVKRLPRPTADIGGPFVSPEPWATKLEAAIRDVAVALRLLRWRRRRLERAVCLHADTRSTTVR